MHVQSESPALFKGPWIFNIFCCIPIYATKFTAKPDTTSGPHSPQGPYTTLSSHDATQHLVR